MSPFDRKQIKFSLFILLLLAVTAFWVNRPALDNGFVTDDTYEIVDNSFVKSWRHLPDLFSKGYISSQRMFALVGQTDIGSGSNNYRPITTLTYFIDYAIWKLNAFGFHLTNVLLLLGSGFLVYILGLRLLSLSPIASCLAAAIFLLHPVNNEVTAVITSRDDSVAFIFFACAVLSYCKFRDYDFKKLPFYFLSLVMYAFGLLSKEMCITLPLIVMVYDYLFPPGTHTKFKERLPFYAGYFVVTALYLWVWFFFAPPDRRDLVDYFGGHGGVVVGTLVQIGAEYLKWMTWPVKIPAVLADEGIIFREFLSPVFILSLILVLSAFILLWISVINKRKKIVFSFLWIGIALGPVLVLPYMLNVLYAARFLYIPFVGFCFALAVIWETGQKNISTRLIINIIVISLLIFYSCVTMNSLPRWKNNLTLSENRLEDFPNNPLIYLAMASEFEKIGMLKESLDACQYSLVVDPHCIECHNQIGMLYLKLGQNEKAKEQFDVARALDPTYEVSQLNYCIALGKLKNFPEAEACYSQLLKDENPSVQVFFNLGICYAQQKKYHQAAEVWQQGLKIDTHYQLIHNALKRLP